MHAKSLCRGGQVALCVFLASVYSGAVRAQQVTVDADRDTPVVTSTADDGAAADVLVLENIRIEVVTGSALTIDSNNGVISDGLLISNGETDTTAVFIDTGSFGTTRLADFTSTGTIFVAGPDADGENPDIATGNFGIRVAGDGSFSGDLNFVAATDPDTGDVIRVNALTVGGNRAAGVAVQASMLGTITNDGSIVVAGDDSTGILIDAPLTGSILGSGSITTTGANSRGIAVRAPVSGTVTYLGSIFAGAGESFDEDGNTLDAVPGEAGILVTADIGAGLVLDGNAIPNAEEADALAELQDAAGEDETVTLDPDGVISTSAGTPAILISTVGTVQAGDLALAAAAGEQPFGLINRGSITTAGSTVGFAATAIRIGGTAGARAIIEGGFLNDGGDIVVSATDADATAVRIGGFSDVATIVNDGEIEATAFKTFGDEDAGEADGPGGDAFGILIAPEARVTSLSNSFLIDVAADGADVSAYGVLDGAGQITDFSNSGTVSAVIGDDAEGRAVALDFSANQTGAVIVNTGDIFGDIDLGAGADSIDTSGGALVGDIDFAGGGGFLTVRDEATLLGSILNGEGVTVTASGADILLATDAVTRIGSASFDAASTLSFEIDAATTTAALMRVDDRLSFEDGAEIRTFVTGIIAEEQDFIIAEAGTLLVANGVGLQADEDIPVLYDSNLIIDDANNRLLLNIRRKTATELGLGANLGAVYEASIGALALDEELSTLISTILTPEEFAGVMEQLTPDARGLAFEIALTQSGVVDQALSNRLSSWRHIDHDGRGGRSSGWGQLLFGYSRIDGTGEVRQAETSTVGLAAGFEFLSSRRAALGVSFATVIAGANEAGDFSGPTGGSSFELGLYGVADLGPVDVPGWGGYGFSFLERERSVEVDELVRVTEADWNSRIIRAGAEIGLDTGLGPVVVQPRIAVDYLTVRESAYEEAGGGDGIDLAFDARQGTSLRGSAALTLGYDIDSGQGDLVRPELTVGYAREFSGDALVTTASFLSTGEGFTLTGAPLPEETLYGGLGFAMYTDATAIRLDAGGEWADDRWAVRGGVTIRLRF